MIKYLLLSVTGFCIQACGFKGVVIGEVGVKHCSCDARVVGVFGHNLALIKHVESGSLANNILLTN